MGVLARFRSLVFVWPFLDDKKRSRGASLLGSYSLDCLIFGALAGISPLREFVDQLFTIRVSLECLTSLVSCPAKLRSRSTFKNYQKIFISHLCPFLLWGWALFHNARIRNQGLRCFLRGSCRDIAAIFCLCLYISFCLLILILLILFFFVLISCYRFKLPEWNTPRVSSL